MEDSNLQTKENNSPSTITRYSWNDNWADQIVHNIPIAKVADEISQLKEIYGEITPQILVDSSKNKKSVFHHYFEWDDAKAANALRLLRASQILSNIQVRIIKDGKPTLLRPIEVKTVSNPYSTTRPYVKRDHAERQDLSTTMARRATINDLRIIVNRLQRLNEAQNIITLLNEAIEELRKESTETKEEVKPLLTAVV